MQKTRLARIHAAKVLANKTFLRGKQKAEALLLARESGLENAEVLNDVDVFQLQHHHLLTCLERTTVRLVLFSPSRLTSVDIFNDMNECCVVQIIVVPHRRTFMTKIKFVKVKEKNALNCVGKSVHNQS